MRRLASGFAALLFVLLGTAALHAQTVQFVFQNADGAGEGFNDATFGAQRVAAMNYAMGRLSTFFQARFVGETVRVRATFDPLGGNAFGAVLGAAGATTVHSGVANQPVANRFYVSALANHRALSDLNGAGTAEISAQFNSDVDNGTVLGATNWYYGTDLNPGIHIDFATVVIHEAGHGLGFDSFLNTDGSYFNNLPTIYDEFMNSSNVGGTKLTSLGGFGAANATRAAEAIGNDLWWDGAFGTAGNGGIRPRLYAPSPFEPGSSLSHTNEATFPNGLMTPLFNTPAHAYDAMELGMFRDMGWTLAAVPEPSTFALIGLAVGGMAYYRRRQNRQQEQAASRIDQIYSKQ